MAHVLGVKPNKNAEIIFNRNSYYNGKECLLVFLPSSSKKKENTFKVTYK